MMAAALPSSASAAYSHHPHGRATAPED